MHDLIDIGANLADSSFDADRDAVVDAALAAGVVQLVLTGSDPDNSERAAAFAATRPGVLASTAGIHPHHAARDRGDAAMGRLADLVAQDHVVAVGECGLDYFRDLSPRDDQQAVMRDHLELAAQTELPVFLHCRDSFADFLQVLEPYRDRLTRAVVHCFTGTGDELAACLAMDLHVGITGWICDERRGTELREIVDRIPAGRLMLETDAPYLMPRTIRPRPRTRRNVPANLPYVLASVAECRGESEAAVAAATTATARRFFGIGTPAP